MCSVAALIHIIHINITAIHKNLSNFNTERYEGRRCHYFGSVIKLSYSLLFSFISRLFCCRMVSELLLLDLRCWVFEGLLDGWFVDKCWSPAKFIWSVIVLQEFISSFVLSFSLHTAKNFFAVQTSSNRCALIPEHPCFTVAIFRSYVLHCQL